MDLKQWVRSGFTTRQAKALKAVEDVGVALSIVSQQQIFTSSMPLGQARLIGLEVSGLFSLRANDLVYLFYNGGTGVSVDHTYLAFKLVKVADANGIPVASAKWERESSTEENGVNLDAGSGAAGFVDTHSNGITVTAAGLYHAHVFSDWS